MRHSSASNRQQPLWVQPRETLQHRQRRPRVQLQFRKLLLWQKLEQQLCTAFCVPSCKVYKTVMKYFVNGNNSITMTNKVTN
jgi:hypothetical protein